MGIRGELMFDHFYSDPHFWHSKILEKSDRPFVSIEEMNAVLIEAYRRLVKPEHVVLWLGDVAFGGQKLVTGILKQLPGKKILIPGNHDRKERAMLRAGFDAVVPSLRLLMGERTVVCSHYPYPEGLRDNQADHGNLPERKKGEVLLHGHTHSSKKRDGNMINCCVDAWDWRPASRGEVESLVASV